MDGGGITGYHQLPIYLGLHFKKSVLRLMIILGCYCLTLLMQNICLKHQCATVQEQSLELYRKTLFKPLHMYCRIEPLDLCFFI